MRNDRPRQAFTLMLVAGAVLFGMLLAGGTELTTVSYAAEETALAPAPAKAVELPPPAGGLPSFADLAEAVSPAVVSLQVATIETSSSRRRGIDPFEFFFGPRRRAPEGEEPPRRRSDSSGSGFVISPEGLIVTNHHVIEDADSLEVTLNGRSYPAEVIGDDPATDLALVKIEPQHELTYLRLGDSDTLRVGEWVMVIGSPLRLENSVSVGVVSAKGRSINITPDSSLENFIQTDAAINFGNSGGPVVDLQGRVVGIATAINYGAENIGFAVPVATLQQILPQLRETGAVKRGYLGVAIADLDYETARAFGLESTDGALVQEVIKDTPSEAAGIRHGDVILGADGRKVHDNRELIDYIASRPPGSVVELEIFRDGEVIEKEVTLTQRDLPGTQGLVQREEEGEEQGSIEWLGLEYRDLTQTARENHGIPQEVDGVWVRSVAPDSPLYDENVAPGDVIAEVNGRPVTSVHDFDELLGELDSGSYARLYVRRFDPRSEASTSFFAVVEVP